MTVFTRRRFLALTGGVSVMLAGGPALAAAGMPREGDRVLVLVQLKGGNDGLNTVIPYSDPAYARLRPNIGLPREQLVQLSPQLALNPALKALLPSWQSGDMALVLGVGYPDPNRSHFRSIEIWDTASASEQLLTDGWVARAFRGTSRTSGTKVDAVVVDDNTLPVSGAGMRNIVLHDVEQFIQQANRMSAAGPDPTANPALRHLIAVQGEIHQAALELRDRMRDAPTPPVDMPAGPFGHELELTTRLLMSRTPLSVIKLGLGSFDTHARQRETQDRLLETLADGLAAFRSGLIKAGVWDRVMVMTYSEFGRRAAENASRGTDHGTAAPVLVMGGKVKGGFHGRQPSLDDLSEGDLRYAVDFRNVYSTVTRRWWGLDRDLMGGRPQLLDFV